MTRRHLAFVILVLFSAWAALAEIPIGAALYGEAPGRQQNPSVASDGDGYLVVWVDDRAGFSSLVGTRMNSRGEMLDGTGIVLLRVIGSQSVPNVIWSGTSYVVFWTHEVWEQSSRLMALRVDRQGRVLGEPRAVATDAKGGPAASNGSRIVAPYVPYKKSEIRAVILDSDANVVDDIQLAPQKAAQFAPTVATNGEEFVVVWNHNDLPPSPPALKAMRISAAGARIDATSREIGRGGLPILASDGEDYLVVTHREGAWRSFTLSTDGSQVSPVSAVFEDFPSSVALVWTGSTYFFYATAQRSADNHDVLRFGIGADGRPDGSRETFATTTWFEIGAATNGRTVLAAWTHGQGKGLSMVGGLWAGTTAGPARVLSESANAQHDAAIAHGDSIDLVAWRENEEIFAMRITADGRSLDGRGRRLGSGTGTPDVVFDGTQFVIAWYEEAWTPLAKVRFISRAGGLDSWDLIILDAGPPSLAAGPDGTLVTWATGDWKSVHAAIIDRDTLELQSAPVVIWEGRDEDDYDTGDARAAWDGSAFLIAWVEYEDWSFGFGRTYTGIRGARLNASQTLLDTAPFLLGDAPDEADFAPGLASDGNGWLLIWESYSGVRARRISAAGVPEGPDAGVVIARGYASDLAWDGTHYVAAWKVWSQDSGASHEIQFGFIPKSGPLAALKPVTVTPTYSKEGISIAAAAPGRFNIAYTRVAFEAMYGSVMRAFVQRLGGSAKQRAMR